jgi:hypothetical protein
VLPSAGPGLPHLPVKAVGYSVKAEVSLLCSSAGPGPNSSLSQGGKPFSNSFPHLPCFLPLEQHPEFTFGLKLPFCSHL